MGSWFSQRIINGGKDINPLLRLLSIALKRWIRTKCKRIGGLEIEINGSNFSLFRGELKKVKVKASKVIFKDIELSKVLLESSPIKVNINFQKENKNLITSDFKLKGNIMLSEKDLNALIECRNWYWIKDWLRETLLEDSMPINFSISDEEVFLVSKTPNKKGTLKSKLIVTTKSKTLLINNKSLAKESLLPMDSLIEIECCSIKNKSLDINFKSTVKI